MRRRDLFWGDALIHTLAVGNLTSLEVFFASAVTKNLVPPLNGFVGTIPASIGQLSNLKARSLGYEKHKAQRPLHKRSLGYIALHFSV